MREAPRSHYIHLFRYIPRSSNNSTRKLPRRHYSWYLYMIPDSVLHIRYLCSFHHNNTVRWKRNHRRHMHLILQSSSPHLQIYRFRCKSHPIRMSPNHPHHPYHSSHLCRYHWLYRILSLYTFHHNSIFLTMRHRHHRTLLYPLSRKRKCNRSRHIRLKCTPRFRSRRKCNNNPPRSRFPGRNNPPCRNPPLRNRPIRYWCRMNLLTDNSSRSPYHNNSNHHSRSCCSGHTVPRKPRQG